jgi:hypothetical protein
VHLFNSQTGVRLERLSAAAGPRLRGPAYANAYAAAGALRSEGAGRVLHSRCRSSDDSRDLLRPAAPAHCWGSESLTVALDITSARPDPALFDLPWSSLWRTGRPSRLAALPRGISRHVVRFVKLSGRVLAVKEIKADSPPGEYGMLRNLVRLDLPCVDPSPSSQGRVDADGEPLDACLITRHLQFSLPYRALYSPGPATRHRRPPHRRPRRPARQLHLAGFWWGDVSLSNTLFVRDAGAFAAYLVDAETGELHARLSDGQREPTTWRSPGSTSPVS